MSAAKAKPRRPVDTFGTRLAIMRQSMGGWNVKKTADFCGFDDQAWRNWESGRSLPRDYERVCRRLADRLGFDVTWVALGGPLAPLSTKCELSRPVLAVAA